MTVTPNGTGIIFDNTKNNVIAQGTTMAITKLKTVRASKEDETPGKQDVQKPEKPATPSKPATPAKPAEPQKPSEPAKPAKATTTMFDEFVVTQEDPSVVEGAMVALISSFKTLVPKPTTANIAALAGAIGVTTADLSAVISSGHTIDPALLDEYGSSEDEDEDEDNTFVSASKCGPKHHVSAASEDAHSSTAADHEEEDDNFLLPMSTMQDPVYQYTARSSSTMRSDATPRNNRTGIDDGAPVVDGEDDAEQRSLMNDGVTDHNAEITDINNRQFNDDGLS